MTDPRKGLPLLNGMTIEQASVQACMDAIGEALKKYNCGLIFQQMHQNGMPAEAGRFVVMKNQSQASEKAVLSS
ncbi:MAG TPA: hypothetical protein VF296_06585 [Gallionella sp.]